MAERMRKKLMHLYDPDMMGEDDSERQSTYGHIPGIAPGTRFVDREACSKAGVHAVRFAGIHASKTGAYSVCLSGGYEDDDKGDFFIYTGTGGQMNSFSGDHTPVGDQTFEHPHNAALKVSADLQRPVRVIRGHNLKSEWAPAEDYRYDGLYDVTETYLEKGVDGFRYCKFVFRRQLNQPPLRV